MNVWWWWPKPPHIYLSYLYWKLLHSTSKSRTLPLICIQISVIDTRAMSFCPTLSSTFHNSEVFQRNGNEKSHLQAVKGNLISFIEFLFTRLNSNRRSKSLDFVVLNEIFKGKATTNQAPKITSKFIYIYLNIIFIYNNKWE